MQSKGEQGPPKVIRTEGRTPDGWEGGGVIFFANLLSLFFGNREGARQLEEEIRCVDSYGGRLLPVFGLIFRGGENILVLEREPDPALSRFFGQLGLELPRVEILTRQEFLQLAAELETGPVRERKLIRRLRGARAGWVDGFVTDPAIGSIAAALGKRTLSTPAGSHRGNNKLLLHQYLEDAGLPVFPTRIADDTGAVRAALAELARAGHRHAAIKAQIGASGIGMEKVATDAPPDRVPPVFFHEGPCLVQAWLEEGRGGIEKVLSPSVQIFLTDPAVQLYDLTEQILDPAASVHQGNESPPPYLEEISGLADELFHQAGMAATWLHRQGYRGPASVDFLVTLADGGRATAHVCEINARVTGATYPSVLARHFLPRGSWRMRNLELAVPMEGGALLDRLDRTGELFDPAEGRGILPVNFNLDPEGRVRKGQFLAVADDLRDCRHLLDAARADLPVRWDYTHDR